MADKILDRLVEAVNSLRQNNAGQGEASRDTTTTNALKDLYPSTRICIPFPLNQPISILSPEWGDMSRADLTK